MSHRLLPLMMSLVVLLSLLIAAIMVSARGQFSDDVFYVQRDGDGWRIYVLDASQRVSAAIGPILRTDTQPNRLEVLRAPGNRFVTYMQGGHIWLVDVPTGERIDLGRGANPAWSPDGRHLAYALDGRIHVTEITSDGSATLVTAFPQADGPAYDSELAWSPDGERLLWLRYIPANTDVEVYVANADGTNMQNLSDDPQHGNWNPAWSPDGERIAYVTYNRAGEEIIIAQLAERTRQSIVTGINYESGPVWAADGQMLAYMERLGGMYFRINAVDVSQQPWQHSLDLSIMARGWGGLYWLPGRYEIVFVHARSGDLYTVDLNGTAHRLTFDGEVKVVLP